jgi:hypothetical protein
MQGTKAPPPPNYGAQPQPSPMAPPAANGPVNWGNQGAMPPSAGGINTTGPGQFAPPGPAGGIPPPPAHFTGARFKQELGNGIRNGLDPAGILGGERNPFKQAGNIVRNTLDPAGVFGGNDPKKVKGVIDPTTGTVDVTNYGKYQPGLEAAYTQMLRTGVVPPELKHGGGAYKGLKRQIRDIWAHGGPDGGPWKWGTPSAGAPTVIPGQGPVNWGAGPGQPPPLGQAPGAGVAPPSQGAGQLPGPGQSGPGSLIPPQAGNPGSQPPPAGSMAPGAPQASWTRPPRLPSPAAYNPQAAVAAALRKPTGGGSKLVGGYTGP